MNKIPTKMLRKLSFNFQTQKTAKIPLFGQLRMAISQKPPVL
jgi:hypothetical protein